MEVHASSPQHPSPRSSSAVLAHWWPSGRCTAIDRWPVRSQPAPPLLRSLSDLRQRPAARLPTSRRTGGPAPRLPIGSPRYSRTCSDGSTCPRCRSATRKAGLSRASAALRQPGEGPARLLRSSGASFQPRADVDWTLRLGPFAISGGGRPACRRRPARPESRASASSMSTPGARSGTPTTRAGSSRASLFSSGPTAAARCGSFPRSRGSASVRPGAERVCFTATDQKDAIEVRALEVRDARGRKLQAWMEWQSRPAPGRRGAAGLRLRRPRVRVPAGDRPGLDDSGLDHRGQHGGRVLRRVRSQAPTSTPTGTPTSSWARQVRQPRRSG